MHEHDRVKLLFGPYRMPRFRVGGLLRCSIRGKAHVRSITDAPIMWPATWRNHIDRRPSLILCGDLVRAVRRESATAVAHHWGVTLQTVWKWRKALGVGPITPGTSDLFRRLAPEKILSESSRAKSLASTQQPERNAKIAAARRGKPRPAHVVEAVRKAHLGLKASAETRKKLSDAQKRRGAYPPAAGRPFTPVEDALLGTAPDREIAEKLGRTVQTIHVRRKRLGIPAFVKRKPHADRVVWTPAMDRKLGKASDADVARKLGCSTFAVFYRRRRLKVPAFRS